MNTTKEYLNLTPHDINVIGDEERIIKASGLTARLNIKTVTTEFTDEVKRQVNGVEIIGENTTGKELFDNIIVSAQSLNAGVEILKELSQLGISVLNRDLITVGETLRDEAGKIIGVKYLVNNG